MEKFKNKMLFVSFIGILIPVLVSGCVVPDPNLCPERGWKSSESVNKSILTKGDAFEAFKDLDHPLFRDYFTVEDVTNTEIEFENENISVWLLIPLNIALDYNGTSYKYSEACI